MIGMLVSGVHWITDIIGGALFSAGVVMIYKAIINLYDYNADKQKKE